MKLILKKILVTLQLVSVLGSCIYITDSEMPHVGHPNLCKSDSQVLIESTRLNLLGEEILPNSGAPNDHKTVLHGAKAEVLLRTNSNSVVYQVSKALSLTRISVGLTVETLNETLFGIATNMMSSKKLTFEVKLRLFNRAGQQINQVEFSTITSPLWKNIVVTYPILPPGINFDAAAGAVSGIDLSVLSLIKEHFGPTFTWTEQLTVFIDQALQPVYSGNTTADMSIGPMSFDLEFHQKGVEFSPPLQPMTIYFFHVKPGPINQMYTMTYPFTPVVWIATIVSIVFMVLVLVFLYKRARMRLSWFHIISITIMGMMIESMPHQYLRIRKRMNSAYFSLFVWISVTTFLSYAYRSILLASLVKVDYEKPVDTFQDLLDKNAYMPLMRGVQSISRRMVEASNPALGELYQRTVEKDLFYDTFPPPKWVEEMTLEGRASQFMTTTHIIGQRHLMRLSSEYLPPMAISGYFYRTGFPHMERFNTFLGRIKDAGIYQAVYDRNTWEMARPERDHERNSNTNQELPLSAAHLTLLWILTGVGLVLAIISFGVEKIRMLRLRLISRIIDMAWMA